MSQPRCLRFAVAFLLLATLAGSGRSAEPAIALPKGVVLEEVSTDPTRTKIVFVAGSGFFKPGEHEYVAGCAVLMDLLRQTPGVFPVLAVDWPTKPETFEGAKAVVFFSNGGDQHGLLQKGRGADLRKLGEAGAGLTFLHQLIDVPKDHADGARLFTGAAWEKGISQRAHWVARFAEFPDHPVFRGVKSFQVDDGWLTGMQFVPEKKGVIPLLRTVDPKAKARPKSEDDAIVAWMFERAGGGRSFTFTGGHLHASFAEEGYRRFLVNSILWTAGVEIPGAGAPVTLDAGKLKDDLVEPPAKKVKYTR